MDSKVKKKLRCRYEVIRVGKTDIQGILRAVDVCEMKSNGLGHDYRLKPLSPESFFLSRLLCPCLGAAI